MDNVNFLPWIGQTYDIGFAGRHILVLGESHYCSSEKDATRQLTRKIIEDLYDSDSVSEPYKNTYTKFVKAMLGRDELSPADKKAFWNSVAFYNYVQVPMIGPRIAPSRDDFKNAEHMFLNVLESLRPDLVISWGARLYNNLPHGGKQGISIKTPDGKWIETWCYYLKDSTQILVLPIMHPASAFSPEYWNQVIAQIL